MRTVMDALSDGETWETRDGRVIPFRLLDLDHAKNLKAWFEREAYRWQTAMYLQYLSIPEPTSDGAWNAWALEMSEFDRDPVEWMRDQVPYKSVMRRLAHADA